MGYRMPLISTLTTRESMGLEVQRLDLLEHVADASADVLALAAQRRQLAAGLLGVGQPSAHGVELGAQARIFFRGPRLLGARPRQLLTGARVVAARLVEHRHELL